MTATRVTAATALVAFAAIGLSLSPAAAAQAAAPTLTFATTEVTTPFGGDWLVEVQVAAPAGYGTVDPTWGTVDIQLDDVPGIYSAGLPIMRGGLVYFARPVDAPLLSAGEHRATAILRPSFPDLLEAQTQTPLVITVTPLELQPKLDLLEVPGDDESPYATLTLSGEFVDALGTPAGSWAIRVERDGTEVLQTTEAVPAGADSVTLSLAELVRPGTTLVVSAVFTPDPAVATGIEAKETTSRTFVSPSLTPVEWLTRSIPVPWWLLAVSLVLLAGAVAAMIVVLVRRRSPHAAPTTDADPEEAVDLEDAEDAVDADSTAETEPQPPAPAGSGSE